jgi:hypothetical protein
MYGKEIPLCPEYNTISPSSPPAEIMASPGASYIITSCITKKTGEMAKKAGTSAPNASTDQTKMEPNHETPYTTSSCHYPYKPVLQLGP